MVKQLFTSNIVDGLRWLDDWPVGLKLNTPLSRLFCETYIGMTSLWQRESVRYYREAFADQNASHYQLPAYNASRNRLGTHPPVLLWREHVYIRSVRYDLPCYAASTVCDQAERSHLSR